MYIVQRGGVCVHDKTHRLAQEIYSYKQKSDYDNHRYQFKVEMFDKIEDLAHNYWGKDKEAGRIRMIECSDSGNSFKFMVDKLLVETRQEVAWSDIRVLVMANNQKDIDNLTSVDSVRDVTPLTHSHTIGYYNLVFRVNPPPKRSDCIEYSVNPYILRIRKDTLQIKSREGWISLFPLFVTRTER